VPLVQVHKALLGLTSADEWFGKRGKKTRKDSRIVVDEKGALTQALRDALADELAKIHGWELLLKAGNQDDLQGLWDYAEEFYRLEIDTVEKLKALGELWKSEKGERMKEPQGRQLIKFASQVHARQARGEGGKDAGSNNNGRGSKPVSGGIKTFDDWERVHGPITRSTQIPSSVRNKWSREDQQRWYAIRYPGERTDEEIMQLLKGTAGAAGATD
jgi:hypothetical protein